ncbi:hypothetical protein JZU71_04900 [bacterium]|nr:hypothetical protein [bacterium]
MSGRYTAFVIAVQKIAKQCGTSIKMIEEYYNKLEAGMSAAEMMALKAEKPEVEMVTRSTLEEWM